MGIGDLMMRRSVKNRRWQGSSHVRTQARRRLIVPLLALAALCLCASAPQPAYAAGATCGAYTTAHTDGTVTVIITVDGAVDSFDYGLAFSPGEAEVTDFGFTDAFLKSLGSNKGTALDHYFEDGPRVSESARYLVFGGMAGAEAAYQGDMAYVTFALKGKTATVALTENSADFDGAEQILAMGTPYVLEAPDAGQTPAEGTDPPTGDKENETGAGKEPAAENEAAAGGEASAENKTGAENEEAAGGETAMSSATDMAGTNRSASSGNHKASAPAGSVQVSGTDTADQAPLEALAVLAVSAGFLLFYVLKTKAF